MQEMKNKGRLIVKEGNRKNEQKIKYSKKRKQDKILDKNVVKEKQVLKCDVFAVANHLQITYPMP